MEVTQGSRGGGIWVDGVLATVPCVVHRQLLREELCSDLGDRETCRGCNMLDSETGETDWWSEKS